MKRNVSSIEVILWNIRSVHNVGSMFRTADAAGVAKIYLAGITPAPVDRFGRARRDLAKVALGAECSVPWELCPAERTTLARFKKEKKVLIALEQSPESIDYKKVSFSGKQAVFLVGNEVSGLPAEVLKDCDVVCEIPMRGKKESLNVSVAFGTALFRMLNR